jgi:outer membrane protein assembly factor BamB
MGRSTWDVTYAPSFSGKMNALDARNGQLLWSFQSGGSVSMGLRSLTAIAVI